MSQHTDVCNVALLSYVGSTRVDLYVNPETPSHTKQLTGLGAHEFP